MFRREMCSKELSDTENDNGHKDIRIILVGAKYCGKGKTGNIILGWNGFDTKDETVENVVRVGEVADRWRVTLVRTPGWWKTFQPDETMELMKMKLIQSVSICRPGPHAFLLVVDLDSILEERSGRSMEQHLELLGGGVWNHTFVLLTSGTWQEEHTSIEDYMEKRGRALHRIMEKCCGRSYLLNNNGHGSRTQVIELLENIEKMVAENGEKLFALDDVVAQDAERRIEDVCKKAKERELKDRDERDALRETYKDAICEEIRLLVVGWFISGKTTIGDAILGIQRQERQRTHRSVVREGQVGRWKVQLVDTPGWSRLSPLKDTPEMVKQEIARGASLCSPGPHVIILVVCASVAFTKAHLRAIKEHMALLGPDVWRHVLVVFNWSDTNGATTLEQFIESEGSTLQWLLKKCNNRYDSLNINNPGQATRLLERIEWMVAENSILSFNATEVEEEFEEEEHVVETTSMSEDILAMFENFCKEREEDLVLGIKGILDKYEAARSIVDPPNLSDEVHSITKVSTWLKEQQRWNTSDYSSDCGSILSNA